MPIRCPSGPPPVARPGHSPSQPFPKMSEINELPHPFAVVSARQVPILQDSWKSRRDMGQGKIDEEGGAEEQQRNENVP